MREEFVSEITTSLVEGIWRVELEHRPIDSIFNIIYGSRFAWSNHCEESLALEEFRSLFKLFKELDRIIEEKEKSHNVSVQQKEFQTDAT